MNLGKQGRFLLSGLISIVSLSVYAAEDAGLRKEKKFHSIYKSYNESKTPEDSWTQVLNLGNSQTYLIQEGDTLWDVSETLFGDPHFYPKIWALNGLNILNPHEISPEEVLYFTEGTVGEPPSLELKAKMEAKEEALKEEKKPPEVDDVLADPSIPAPLVVRQGAKPIPKSFPTWEFNPSATRPFQMEIKPNLVTRAFRDSNVITYVQSDYLKPDGAVVEIDGGYHATGEEHYVYIKLDVPPTENKFVLAHEISQISNEYSGETAHQIQIEGQVELVEKANSEKGIYRAKVLRLYNHIWLGAHAIAGEIAKYNTDLNGSKGPDVDATIFGGAGLEDRSIFGFGEIVYLNAGSEKGLADGQILQIYRDESLRNSKTIQRENRVKIGALKLIRVGARMSTAVIVVASEEIWVGDRTNPNSPSEGGNR